METVLVTLKHEKAKKLLQSLEELNLIELQESPKKQLSGLPKISDLKGKMQAPFESSEATDKQLAQLRNEWERNF